MKDAHSMATICRRSLICLACGACCVTFAALNGAEIAATPSNYASKLTELQPGDTLVLGHGNYTNNLHIWGMAGTAANPITIKGPTGSRSQRAVFLATENANTISIKNAKYIVFENLYLDNNGYEGPHGFKAEASSQSQWAHHITIENCIIDGYGKSQQQVAISTKCPTWNWIIKGNQILGAGTGMYLGNSDGSAEFVNGVIKDNYIENTVGYNIEIKHQNTRTQFSEGMPHDGKTIIRGNTFIKQTHSALSEGGRPNLLVDHFPLTGDGANDSYCIYDNIFYENNDGERLFQGNGNVNFYNNLLINTHGDGISMQPHNSGTPGNMRIFYNTILCAGKGVSISGANSSYQQKVIGNLICSSGITAADQSQNILSTYANADNYVINAHGAHLADYNLVPLLNKATASDSIATASFNSAELYQLDFNGDRRDTHYRGAYSSEAHDPGAVSQAVTPNTLMPSNVQTNQATLNASIPSTGRGVYERGFVWSSSSSPDFSDHQIIVGAGTGSFTTVLNSLTANTTYYYRAYAKNGIGNQLGASKSFTTSSSGGSSSISIAINFQPQSAPSISGYLVDSGLAYANRGNRYHYGWSQSNTHSRDRNSSNAHDQRDDTLLYFAKQSALTWSISLANGDYDLTLVCGDPSYTAQTQTIKIESQTYSDANGQSHYDTINARVSVNDGNLSISAAAGAVDAKICYLLIQSVPAAINN